MAKAKEEKQKTKRPTALKRDEQSLKKQMLNKAFKSRIRTAMRSFEAALSENDKEGAQEKLTAVHSVMDRAVKRGIYKRNKAARLKSQATKKIATPAA